MYKCIESDVTVDSKIRKVYFPEKHSTVKAIVFERWDNNAGDPTCNISDNRTVLRVLWKGYHKWDVICNGEYGKSSKYDVRYGLHSLLYDMENDDAKHKMWRKGRIAELEISIKEDKKLLKDLKKEEATEKEDIRCL